MKTNKKQLRDYDSIRESLSYENLTKKVTLTKTETEMYVALSKKILWLLDNKYYSNVNATQYFKGVRFAFETYRDILKDKYNMKHSRVGFLNIVGASYKKYNLSPK